MLHGSSPTAHRSGRDGQANLSTNLRRAFKSDLYQTIAGSPKSLADPSKKIGNGCVECLCENTQSANGQIFLAAFDRSNVGTVQSEYFGEFLLVPASSPSQSPHAYA